MEQHIQRYTKYIHEVIHKMDLETATYKDHLHKVFEWYGCIQLSRESGRAVLRWEDMPANLREEKGMTRDMGIDAWDMEGNRVVQMKLYSGVIGWRSFSTFWSACYSLFEDSEKILYRNAESTLHPLIQANLQKGKLRDMTVTNAEFRSACRAIQKKRKIQVEGVDAVEVVLRPYQREAIAMIEKAKDEEQNLMICLPTGTGKTVVTLQYHVAHPEEKMLILVPTLVLMEQWSEACRRVGVEAYLVGTNQHRSLGEYAEQSVVVCVYDSFGTIAEEVGRFGRMVVDEAHHILVPERYMETEQEFEESGSEDEDEEEEWEGKDEENEDESKKEKRPVSYLSQIRSLSMTQRVIYLSATIDKPEDGSLFYEYKVRQAIQDGYLCDYEFIFPIFEREYETNHHLAEYLVHRQQETHCLVYASNRAEGKEFVDRLNALQPGCAGYVDGTTRPASRKKLFADFESGKIRFLVNIRVLVEGFNAPHIRSVFFLCVSSSDIFIIQAIGRALRLHADKIKARVYVPFTHEGDIDRIQAFLTQLASYDERVGKSIRGKRVGGYVRVERGEEAVVDVDDGEEKGEEKGEKEEVFEFRYNLVVDRMGSDSRGQLEAMALRRAEEYIAWVGEKGRRPKLCLARKEKRESATEEERVEHRFANWLNDIKRAKNGKHNGHILYPSVEKRLNDALGEEWSKKRDFEDHQIKRAHEYIRWITDNERYPARYGNRTNLTDKERFERKQNVWMNNIKKYMRNPNKIIIYSSVINFLNKELGDRWWEKEDLESFQLERANKYIVWAQIHGRNPSKCLNSKSKDAYEQATDEQKLEQQLAVWLGNVKVSIKKKDRTYYPSVEKRLSDALGDVVWKKKNLEDEQLEKANNYIHWVQVHNRYPAQCLSSRTEKIHSTIEGKEEYSLAIWMNNLKNTVAGKKKGILYLSLEKRLNEGLGEGWWKREDLEQLQLERANEYIEWVRENGKMPSKCLNSKSSEERENIPDEKKREQRLAVWLGNMRESKKKGGRSLYPKVEQLLNNIIGLDWYITKRKKRV